jgi:hypothetical protein
VAQCRRRSLIESVTAPPSQDVLTKEQSSNDKLRTLLAANTVPRLEKQSIPGTTVSICLSRLFRRVSCCRTSLKKRQTPDMYMTLLVASKVWNFMLTFQVLNRDTYGPYFHLSQEALNLLVTVTVTVTVTGHSSTCHYIYIFLHNVLNVLVQIANKMELQTKKKYRLTY